MDKTVQKTEEVEAESVELKEFTLSNGKVVIFPQPNKTYLENRKRGYRRKIRNLGEARAQEEIFWLMLEENLNEYQLAVWDELTDAEDDELQELIGDDSLPKE